MDSSPLTESEMATMETELDPIKGTDTASFLRANGFVKKKNGNVLLDSDGKMIPNMSYAFLEEERWYSFGKNPLLLACESCRHAWEVCPR